MSENKMDLKTSNQLAKLGENRNVPVNLRQTGDRGSRMLISQRVRKSPFWHLSEEAGAWAYTVYNNMYHPRAYIPTEEGGLLKEYEYLTKHVTMWNVAVERQIQVKGPDAPKLVDLAITRSVEKVKTGRGRYVILCNEEGGIINDPVLLRPYEDEFWFSLSDSDTALWLQALKIGYNLDCTVKEIDVAPVQIQGPKAVPLMEDLFGKDIHDVRYYGLMEGEVNGCSVLISNTGFSGEAGYEIYLYNATANADFFWNFILEAGEPYNIRVIAPGHIRRLEAGILSYGQDMDQETTPYEVGLGWQVDLTKDKFIGKEALQRLNEEDLDKHLVGMKIGGKQIDWYPADFYIIYKDYDDDNNPQPVGYITSAFYSPEQGCNIGFAMLPKELSEIGTAMEIYLPAPYADALVPAEVAATPFKASENTSTALTLTGRQLKT